jgi:flagellar P-ring protein precursor FlgI
MVSARIGPFNRVGTRLDVTVSSIDDASSLQGGMLVVTPLRGVDNQVYALAEGPLSIGGFNIQGQAAGVQKNHTTVGRIPNGAIVEKEALGPVVCDGKSKLLLRDADFNTARLMAKVINQNFPGTAHALDAGAVGLVIPAEFCTNPVAFLSEVGLLEVEPDTPARVVINERTGTVVVGGNVKISAAAVAHANLTVVITETPLVSQPEPFSRGGRTTVVPRTQVGVSEDGTRLNVLPAVSTVGELARALNALGVSPRDLITIFQQLQGAGALHADLVLN